MQAMLFRLTMLFMCVVSIPHRAAGADAFLTLNPHIRAAWSYLRTANTDLALVELDEFGRLVNTLPAGEVEKSISDAMTAALQLTESANLTDAQEKVFEARRNYRAVHERLGVIRFEDCIWDANRLGDGLWPTIGHPADFTNNDIRMRIATELAQYRDKLSSCNQVAFPTVSNDPEFRRLMDGTLPSLEKALAAAKDGDQNTYYRYMIEIVSYDHMLYFRFG